MLGRFHTKRVTMKLLELTVIITQTVLLSFFGLINSGSSSAQVSDNAYASNLGSDVPINGDNRYILNVTMRRDGSSRFSKDKRYGTFPSASFAWRIINEPFFPKGTPLNDLKLRASWGKIV